MVENIEGAMKGGNNDLIIQTLNLVEKKYLAQIRSVRKLRLQAYVWKELEKQGFNDKNSIADFIQIGLKKYMDDAWVRILVYVKKNDQSVITEAKVSFSKTRLHDIVGRDYCVILGVRLYDRTEVYFSDLIIVTGDDGDFLSIGEMSRYGIVREIYPGGENAG